ncbi:phage tail assembly chaperone [Paraburkholderia jirisanensis]
MLSPHEFATLLLVKDAPNQVDMERGELDALLERQLVQLEMLASGREQWRVTESGDSALRAIKRFS